MSVSPYLVFNGRCEEAIDYYKRVLGAEVEMMMRFSDAPDGPPPGMPDEAKSKIMHSSFKVAGSAIMATDGMCTGPARASNFEGFSLSIEVPDAAEAERVFGALADDGRVTQPLVETFFSPRFGMVVDKLGVAWIVVAAAKAA